MTDETTTSAVTTVLGSTRRDRSWRLPDELHVTTALGRARFDLRGAVAPEGDEVEMTVRCFLGSVLLIVPAGTKVILDGQTVIARVNSDVCDDGEDSHIPLLNITASSVMGRVRVCTPDRLKRAPAEVAPIAAPAAGATRADVDSTDVVMAPADLDADDSVTDEPAAADTEGPIGTDSAEGVQAADTEGPIGTDSAEGVQAADAA